MSIVFSLFLAAAIAPAAAPPPPPRVIAVARVSAEVLRAATTAPLSEPDALARQARRAAGGQVLLEFD